MRILMLGWEFPPFISGGLGTACFGLTRALDRQGHEVVFVLPKPVDRTLASHIRLLSPGPAAASAASASGNARGRVESFGIGSKSTQRPARTFDEQGLPDENSAAQGGGNGGSSFSIPGFEHAVFKSVPAGLSSPYPGAGAGGVVGGDDWLTRMMGGDGSAGGVSASGAEGVHPALHEAAAIASALGGNIRESALPAVTTVGGASAGAGYEGDMMLNVERYARLVVAMCRRERFDVIHAHDWMTFPAGLALSQVCRKPVVIHVHSTEFDRAGDNVNQQVYDIERRGMHGATRVIAVSELTKRICVHRYATDPGKIEVVYNGIDSEQGQPRPEDRIEAGDKIVLFLGRITMQKGPEYFIRSAKRVLERMQNVKFVVAGSGDMVTRMIDEAAHLGIGHKVLFTGFLRGADVDRVFRMADVYVMPSVSEPFGIAPLEAIRNDVPVIISKQSGVSEVLTHALKVDFWDIDEMANKIVAVLKHPPLGQTLREHGAFEVRKLTWDGAAAKCVRVYEGMAR
ncbi:MAG: glycosyltransferase [Phycisphaeraceae bacterium]|nr:glycosyltransferase [Phycisphaeraceae bacterium]